MNNMLEDMKNEIDNKFYDAIFSGFNEILLNPKEDSYYYTELILLDDVLKNYLMSSSNSLDENSVCKELFCELLENSPHFPDEAALNNAFCSVMKQVREVVMIPNEDDNETIPYEQSIQEKFQPGMDCVAVLPEDNEWHEAKILKWQDTSHISIVFVEYDYIHSVSWKDIRLMEDLIDHGSENNKNDEDTCQLCGRFMNLTKHHLIPRSVHSRYLKRGQYTRAFLSQCIDICRPCHNVVHSEETNKELAENYNTLEKLCTLPGLHRWIQYAQRSKVQSKPRARSRAVRRRNR